MHQSPGWPSSRHQDNLLRSKFSEGDRIHFGLMRKVLPQNSGLEQEDLTNQPMFVILGIDTGNVSGTDAEIYFGGGCRTSMARKKSGVTIHDVAAAAGVSVSTVSRVLNDKDDVAAET
jgi:hypothetical protein